MSSPNPKIKMSPEDRQKYIGASDAAAALGLSRWKTQLELYAEKTGIIPIEDISGKLPVRLGVKMEDAVAELFMEESGKKVHRVNETLFHPQYPFLGANLDRRVVGEDAVLECKAVSPWKSKEWEGEEIPQEYIIQVYHQLIVSGKDHGYIAVAIGNQDFKWKRLDRDDKLVNQILTQEVYFWETFVAPKVMPEHVKAADTDVLQKLFPHANPGSVIHLDDDFNRKIEFLEAMKGDKKSLETRIEQVNNELKSAIKGNETGDTGIYRIGWTNVHRNGYTVEPTDFRMLKIKKIEKS